MLKSRRIIVAYRLETGFLYALFVVLFILFYYTYCLFFLSPASSTTIALCTTL